MYLRTISRLRVQCAKTILFQKTRDLKHPFVVLQRQIVSVSQLSKCDKNCLVRLFSNDGDSIVDSESESYEDHLYEESISDFSFKKVLYHENDAKVRELNSCTTVQEVFDMLARDGSQFESIHLVQTVLLLWDFCRKAGGGKKLQDFIKEHPEFKLLLERLSKSISELNANESTCCFLYLKRIGVESNKKIMQDLLLDNLDAIKKGKDFPLSALSRFSVALSTDRHLNIPLIAYSMMPHVLLSLKQCKTTEEMRLITICLAHIRQMVTVEILDMYKSKVQELIKNKQISLESTKCIIKVLNFLNHPVWSYRNSSLSRQLMLILLPVVDDLFENEVKAVFKIFQSQLEPAAIAPKLLNVSERLLEKLPSPEVLSCVVQFVEPKKREHLIEMFRTLMADDSNWQHPSASLHFFTILRSLKISDNALCDEYWNKVLKDINISPEGKEHYVFSRHCHRYMYFNNNLGGTYRHKEFEKQLTSLCMSELATGISGSVPSKFANIAPFVIGYGHTYRGNMKLPNLIVSKIESMADQFNVVDCLQLSRGIQIALEMRFRHFVPKALAAQLLTIDNALHRCAQRHLNNLQEADGNDLNAIVRALNNRKASRKSTIYQQALNKYNDVQSNTLNSRLLRNMSFNLSTSHFVAPEIIETMFDYIVKHEEYVTGDTAEKILSCSYNLGYSPQLQEALYSSANIVMRDFDYMTGLSIIQACLALCFYKTIPPKLIDKVFSVDFIKRIEEEIEMCYSKATYPERVLNHVMQLNRAVCLDFPEADIPWFQQTYLEAQLSKYPVQKTRYSEDVKSALMSVLKDESLFRCNHVTPYGYRIDFVIHFDKEKQSIFSPVETTMLDKITKVAILLLKLDSLCENDLNTLRGTEALKVRHLEMLGYKVIHINEANWNNMKSLDAQTNYLKCLLQISG